MASAYEWTTRCIPAFSCLLLGMLLVFSFLIAPYGKSEDGKHNGIATLPQYILAGYCVFLHILSIIFPIRVCWSMRDVLRRTRDSMADISCASRRSFHDIKDEHAVQDVPTPLFVILLPAYKEEMTTLEETLRVLASHGQARYHYHVYIAMEEKEEKSAFKASRLCATFQHSFYRISYTVHPENIPGEAQGKSSNEAWAARQAMHDYPDPAVKRNTIITTMDADTHLSSRYFTQIARMHDEAPDTRDTTMYVPPLVFDRNLHKVPLFVRTSDLMWAGAGLSSLYSGSQVCIPTSVYSLPMSLVERVGGWDTGPGAIGEDMHMYLKCFFALSGRLTVQKVYAAASQCNVSSDENGVIGYYKGLQARYKQALRHMWGSLDTGYALRESVKMARRHRQATKYGQSDVAWRTLNSHWPPSYTSTDVLLPEPLLLTPVEDDDAELAPPASIHWYNVCTLYHRLFEAHFLPIHLVTILAASGLYAFFYPAFLIPSLLNMALNFSGVCRLIGFCVMLMFFYLYERYHRLCVGIRKEEMRQAGLLENMEDDDGFTTHIFQYIGLFEIAVFPIGGFIFGAIPALHAVLSHLVTDRLTYVVSLKPQITLREWRDVSRMTL